jgi:AraC family transcriptional regulator
MDLSTSSPATLRPRGESAPPCIVVAPDADAREAAFPTVDFRPASVTRRQIAGWRGLGGELMRTIRPEPFQSRYCGLCHLLIAYECAQRHEGETLVDGVLRSTLRDLTHKLVFIPAGSEFREWHKPRGLMRAIYLHLEPDGALMRSGVPVCRAASTPRLFFENPVLWQTALKFKALIEAGPAASRLYAEALAVVLSHELVDGGARMPEPPARGGLASWQRRAIAQYMEEHLAEPISLAELAAQVRLSPYHFSRTFKRSFGVPPHRYHAERRIERAKILLANRSLSVLEIALELGFGQSSSFAAVFHKLTGQTPSDYRRSLV